MSRPSSTSGAGQHKLTHNCGFWVAAKHFIPDIDLSNRPDILGADCDKWDFEGKLLDTRSFGHMCQAFSVNWTYYGLLLRIHMVICMSGVILTQRQIHGVSSDLKMAKRDY